MSWSQGYPVHATHRALFHPSTGPTYAGAALRLAGYDPGPLVRCCELGFGQGISLAIHAAMGGCWWGADFMPEQVARVRGLAPDAVLSDEDFAGFCGRGDLPEFDMVVVHGVWSWISAANRRVVLDFVRRRLRPGGVFHVSYNTAAGWASLAPLRHLLQRHVARMAPAGMGPVRAVEQALSAAREILQAKSVYAAQNPLAGEMLERMISAGGGMIVHEWMGAHWTLFHFAEVAAEMATAKLGFACQAARLPYAPSFYFTAEQVAILDEIADPVFRETVQEVLTGERYRRDYWVKGAPRLPRAAEAARAVRFALVGPAAGVALRPDLPQGQRDVAAERVAPVLAAMAGHGAMRLDEIAQVAAWEGMDEEAVREAVMLLWDAGVVQPAQEEAAAAASVAGCRRLNDAIIASAGLGGGGVSDAEIVHLADPVTGSGVAVGRVGLRLLQAERAGCGALVNEAASRAFEVGMRPVLRAHGIV